MQLRYRDQGQFDWVKQAAEVAGLSVNEYVLRKVEADDGQSAGSGTEAVEECGGVTGAGGGRLGKPRGGSKRKKEESRRPPEDGNRPKDGGAAVGGEGRGESGAGPKVKKLTAEEFIALPNSEQLRAMREGRW
jgi:hypothetical protein